MSTPLFLSLDYCPMNDADLLAGVVDVQDIIDRMDTLLVTNLGYTNPSTGLYVSPVDVWGRFYDMLLTRIDDETLEIRFRDQTGATVRTGRTMIDNGGTDVEIFSTYYSVGIVVHNPADTVYDEYSHCHILEQSPDDQSDNDNYIMCGTYRNGSSAVDSNGGGYYHCHWIGNDAAGFIVAWRNLTLSQTIDTYTALISAGGTYLFYDALASMNYSVIGRRRSGRLPHAYFAPRELSPGTTVEAPISDTEQTNFRIMKLHDGGSWMPWLALRETATL